MYGREFVTLNQLMKDIDFNYEEIYQYLMKEVQMSRSIQRRMRYANQIRLAHQIPQVDLFLPQTQINIAHQNITQHSELPQNISVSHFNDELQSAYPINEETTEESSRRKKRAKETKGKSKRKRGPKQEQDGINDTIEQSTFDSIFS